MVLGLSMTIFFP